MAIPAFFLGKAMGKKKGGGETKTVTKTVMKEPPKQEAPATVETQEEKRRKALQANTLFGTTSQSQEQGLL